MTYVPESENPPADDTGRRHPTQAADGAPRAQSRDPMSETLERFCKTTRSFHWTFASCFLTLAGSGALLALRDELGLAEDLVARLVGLHETAALGLVLLPAFVILTGDTRAALRDLRAVFRFSRPDLEWLALQPLAAVGLAELPPAGKLNAGQKVNSLAVAGLTAALAITGTILWARPGSLVAWFVHLACFIAWIPLFAGHLALALVIPGTRPALRGMLTGRVHRDWAAHHHPLWVEEVEGHPLPKPGRHLEPVPPAPAPVPKPRPAVHARR